MQTHLENDLEHAYLVFDSFPVNTHTYLLQMALRCHLDSILQLSIVSRDGISRLRADVTACTSLSSRFANASITGDHVRRILHAILNLVKSLPAYLMDPRDLYLEPDAVFFGPSHDEVLLCYVPGLSDDMPDSARLLADFFLKKINHSDPVAASLAYGLFDSLSADNYVLGDVISDLLSSLTSSDVPTSPDAVRPYDTAVSSRDDPVYTEAHNSDHSHDGTRPDPRASIHSYASGRGQSASGHDQSAPRREQSSVPGRRHAKDFHAAAPSPHRRASAHPQSASRDIMRFLPSIVITGCAAAVIILFHLDMTQIVGMGFLCAALIWIVHNAMESHRSNLNNIWTDEDETDDDEYYRALLREVYSQDAPNVRPFQAAMSVQTEPGPEGGNVRDHTDNVRPRLLSLQKETSPDIILDRDHMLIGKSKKNADAVLSDQTVSRTHARIERRTDGYYVTDLYSTNGTFMDGERLEPGQACQMRDGSILSFASAKYRICLARPF